MCSSVPSSICWSVARSVRPFCDRAMPIALARRRCTRFSSIGPGKKASITPRLRGGACHTSTCSGPSGSRRSPFAMRGPSRCHCTTDGRTTPGSRSVGASRPSLMTRMSRSPMTSAARRQEPPKWNSSPGVVVGQLLGENLNEMRDHFAGPAQFLGTPLFRHLESYRSDVGFAGLVLMSRGVQECARRPKGMLLSVNAHGCQSPVERPRDARPRCPSGSAETGRYGGLGGRASTGDGGPAGP
jgi:hypothetical protein